MVIQIAPLNDEEAILFEKAKNIMKCSTYSKALKKALKICIEAVEKENEEDRKKGFKNVNRKLVLNS